MSSMDAVLHCEQLSKVYKEGPQDIVVLEGVELSLMPGERLAIIGSSGAGKSTLLNLLGGLDVPTSGAVSVAGQALSVIGENERGKIRNKYLGFVYQFHHLLGEFSAEENVAMPLLIAGIHKNHALSRAREMLAKVGLGERLGHKPAELSGGERQRVAIARSVVTQPACVLMDEPTGNLDEDTAESIESLLMELNQQLGLSFIIVTHDKRLAFSLDRTLELTGGKLVEAQQGENLHHA